MAHGMQMECVAMNQAQNIIPRLKQLTGLERDLRQVKEKSSVGQTLAAEIAVLRELLPTSILAHHDSFRRRGKSSIAAVVRGVCRGCHLALPRGRVTELQRIPDDLSVCDNCGVFIYLADEPAPPQEPKEKRKATSTKREKRLLASGIPKSSHTH